MVVTELTGELGNQLFQYSVGRHLSILYDTELFVDINKYEKKEERNYGLHFYCHTAKKFKGNKDDLFLIKENKNEYNDNIFIFEDEDIYLSGDWNNEKYFIDIDNIIKKDLKIKPFYMKNYLENKPRTVEELLEKNEITHVNIRKQDFLKNEANSIDYYKKAFEFIEKIDENPFFFIFSDDVEWAEKQLDFIENKKLFKNNLNYIDLYLMGLCKNNIISNNKSDWWGAWLNKKENRTIICPQEWYIEENNKMLIPNYWIQM